jgi:hypothetical protein
MFGLRNSTDYRASWNFYWNFFDWDSRLSAGPDYPQGYLEAAPVKVVNDIGPLLRATLERNCLKLLHWS